MSYVDVLLFVFIVSVFLLEIRQLKSQYVVKMTRSPDGEQAEYSLGDMSIQRAAVWLLEQYYKDFVVFNPWQESVYKKRSLVAPPAPQIVEQNERSTYGNNNSMRKKDKISSETRYIWAVCLHFLTQKTIGNSVLIWIGFSNIYDNIRQFYIKYYTLKRY